MEYKIEMMVINKNIKKKICFFFIIMLLIFSLKRKLKVYAIYVIIMKKKIISINKDINKDEIEFNSLLEIILNFKKTTFSAYEKFCYNMNRKIKLNEMFKRCKTNIVT